MKYRVFRYDLETRTAAVVVHGKMYKRVPLKYLRMMDMGIDERINHRTGNP